MNTTMLTMMAVASHEAHAQTVQGTAPSSDQNTQRDAAGPEKATETDTSGKLTEIVVTAQRRRESRQDVPISIAVVGGETLSRTNFRALGDLQYVVPGLQTNQTNGGGFQIRGVGTQAFDYSLEQAVSVVVDNVIQDAPRDPGLTGLNDIDRVEVLRGPQGTLFGKNSTSGVVSITTRSPVLGKTSGTVSASYGERNDYNLNGVVNLPLGSDAALRLTGFGQGQGGYGRNTFRMTKAGKFREEGTRGKLLFRPTSNLRILINGDYAHHFDNAPFGTLQSATPAFVAASAAAGVIVGPRNFDTADAFLPKTTSKSYGGDVEINFDIGRQTLTSITAYRKTSLLAIVPNDLIPAPFFINENTGAVDTNKISQEIRLASPTGQFFEYVVGGLYNRLRLSSTQSQWGPLGAPLPPNVYLALTGAAGTANNQTRYDTRNETSALFGQIKVTPIDKVSFSFGGRLTHDVNSQAISFGRVETTAVVIPLSPAPAIRSGTAKATNFSYTVHAQYKPSRDLLFYATYSTGYKGPGIAFISNTYSPYKAEKVKSYEVGFNSEFFNRRLRLNANLFYEKFTDFQTQILNIPPVGVPVYVIGNAGGLRVQGFDIDSTAVVTNNLTVSSSVSYTDGKYTNYNNGIANYSGERLNGAPRWTWTLGANYHKEIVSGYRLDASGNYSRRSGYDTDLRSPGTHIPGYGLLGGRIGVGPVDGRWQAGVYARNLLNTHFRSGFYDLSAIGVGVIASNSPLAFRTVGGFVNVSF